MRELYLLVAFQGSRERIKSRASSSIPKSSENLQAGDGLVDDCCHRYHHPRASSANGHVSAELITVCSIEYLGTYYSLPSHPSLAVDSFQSVLDAE